MKNPYKKIYLLALIIFLISLVSIIAEFSYLIKGIDELFWFSISNITLIILLIIDYRREKTDKKLSQEKLEQLREECKQFSRFLYVMGVFISISGIILTLIVGIILKIIGTIKLIEFTSIPLKLTISGGLLAIVTGEVKSKSKDQ